jgi:glucosylceramidase
MVPLIPVHAQPPANKAAPSSLHWVCSTEAERWKAMSPTTVAPGTTSAPSAGSGLLVLDPTKQYQSIDGFGGCFNGLAWQALLALDERGREDALKALFTSDGCNFNLGRAPIGANDFSLGWYSLNETPGDYAMKQFSIERDRRELIPFIKAAMKYQPKLGIWGVPWTPPSWMKTSGHYKGGELKQDPETLKAYALYFSKYVKAYREEGINLYAVMPQNEPNYNDNVYPQCAVSPAAMNVFVRDYLVPRFKADKLNVEVWLGTIVKPANEFMDATLGDPATRQMITGVGFQYEGRDAFARTHEKYPEQKLVQTETECNKGQNTWAEGLTTFRRVIEDTSHFANGYFFWNMILNETGRSTWDWRQNSLITVIRRKQKVVYNPEFFAMKHFSVFVQPGARRIEITGSSFKNIVAFRNPAGDQVIVFVNDAEQPVSAELEVAGARVKLNVPAKSMNTVTIQ